MSTEKRVDSNLAVKIEVTDDKAQYDENVKWILSDKIILAHILAGAVAEYKGMDIHDIIPLIEGEAQKDYYPGYDLVTRGVFYTARMISAQLGTEFSKSEYDNLKKVYSIWITMDVPKFAENTITEYSIQQKNIVGDFPKDKNRYDLLSVLMIGLAKEVVEKREDRELHRLLGAVLSPDMTVETKKQILESEFQIPMTEELDRRVKVMCNLSEAIEEKGEIILLISLIRKKMSKGQKEDIIAEAIEKDVVFVKQVRNTIIQNPKADDLAIYKKIMEQKQNK